MIRVSKQLELCHSCMNIDLIFTFLSSQLHKQRQPNDSDPIACAELNDTAVNYALEVAFSPVRVLWVFFACSTQRFSYSYIKYSIVKVCTKSCGLIIQMKRLQQSVFVVLTFFFICNMNFEIYFWYIQRPLELKGGKREDKPLIIFLVQIVYRMFPVTRAFSLLFCCRRSLSDTAYTYCGSPRCKNLQVSCHVLSFVKLSDVFTPRISQYASFLTSSEEPPKSLQ